MQKAAFRLKSFELQLNCSRKVRACEVLCFQTSSLMICVMLIDEHVGTRLTQHVHLNRLALLVLST